MFAPLAAGCARFNSAVCSKVDADLLTIVVLQDYRSRLGSWPSEDCLTQPASDFNKLLGLRPNAVLRDSWGRAYVLRLPDAASKRPGYVCSLGADGVPDGYGEDRDVIRLLGP
jgi:hypothetical protein